VTERLRLLRGIGWTGGPGFLRALAFAAAVPLLVRAPLPRLSWWLEPSRRHRGRNGGPGVVEEVVGRVEAALAFGRPVVRPGCLTRGLTMYRFLREAGLDVELCFGVGVVQGAHHGHCWLVRAGEPFLERTDPRPAFVEMCRIPLTGRPRP
jgi:hypothetical protein